jgi:hypothetical protein
MLDYIVQLIEAIERAFPKLTEGDRFLAIRALQQQVERLQLGMESKRKA